MTPLLTAQRLGHTFGRTWLFRQVSMELGAGDVLVVTGRNGSGKSTLLKCLAGLISPREGSVSVHGEVGYAALDLAVYPQLTGREHLELVYSLSGLQGRADDVLDSVGLSGAGEQAAGEYSTGMRARLKLALALARTPNVLLLDEPTAALDELGRAMVESLVRDFSGAVVVATNDPAERRWATHELAIE